MRRIPYFFLIPPKNRTQEELDDIEAYKDIDKSFNEDLANWALKHFQREVTQEKVERWRKNDLMPDWLFKEERLKVYNITISLACKMIGVSLAKFCRDIGVDYLKKKPTWFAPSFKGPDIKLQTKRRLQVEEYFKGVRRIGELSQPKPRIRDNFYFLEYNTEGKLIAFHFMKTTNHHVTYSDSQVINGEFKQNYYKGKVIEDFVNETFIQVNRRTMKKELRKVNRLYLKFF